jgi:glutaredoxin 3
MKPILIYTKDYCPYCDKAKAFFQIKSIPYTEIDITHDPEKQQEMLTRAAPRRTVPQIFVGETGIGGYDDMMKMHQESTLMPLITA